VFGRARDGGTEIEMGQFLSEKRRNKEKVRDTMARGEKYGGNEEKSCGTNLPERERF
jgi:hypothetical protein